MLVEKYAGQARRLARAILGNTEDGDDAAQDGFLAALKGLERYDPNRPFGPWLLRIVANAASDRRRRLKVRAADPLPDDAVTGRPGPDRMAERSQLRAALEAALARLPPRQRIAVVLFDVEGYSHREIAEVVNVSEGTVRSDVFHARRALRETMGAWHSVKEEP
ncbi:MAG: sigma-70 family RNA polymerase sigma factor [Gemmatimonadetes bacterium]|nr:sigma-70 family RNA polymerase sigma factor [Gemmatimonadota bacterium]